MCACLRAINEPSKRIRLWRMVYKVWGVALDRGVPRPRGQKAPSRSGFGFMVAAAGSAGAVAAVLEHALLEERREVANSVFGQMEAVTVVAVVGSERRTG